MPLAVARKLTTWGHEVDIVEPGRTVSRVTELLRDGGHDAWVLKTVSGGPGLSLLEAAAAAGVMTINDARAIRPVRDKAVAAAVARKHGIPFPVTYFAAVPDLLRDIPDELYPVVVKPATGSSCRSVHLVRRPDDLIDLRDRLIGEGFLLAQPYVVNPGADVKVYCVGDELYATEQPSPLHPRQAVEGRAIPLAAELAALVSGVGAVFGLSLYGVDVLEGPDGWVVVDVNDFPSYHWVPDAVTKVARGIVRMVAGELPRPGALGRAS
ncbi:RimK family alpha-L-glutamate ligase [Amycolatopsis sp. NPDC059021]|uniref:ATP-grasp domain-containing protein n=1 Tax=Amycolatopsis sp. NPDC059021 TaxID=3346704 RepID=UPI003672A630